MTDTTPMPDTTPMSPEDLNDLLAGLHGFGILENEEVITMTVGPRTVRLRFTNLSNEDEITGMLRSEGLKGYPWIHRCRCELLARAITWINGSSIADGTFALCPYTREDRPIRLILVDLLLRWGQEAILILWKIYMAHCQRIENNLIDAFPDTQIMTEAERRYMSRIEDEALALGIQALQETAEQATSEVVGEGDSPVPKDE